MPREGQVAIVATRTRVLRCWGPARIAYPHGLNPATAHRVPTRYRIARLSHMDRATDRVIRRYEHAAPGDLTHVDIKKLGNIPNGGGHQALGRQAGRKNRIGGGGYSYLHNAVPQAVSLTSQASDLSGQYN